VDITKIRRCWTTCPGPQTHTSLFFCHIGIFVSECYDPPILCKGHDCIQRQARSLLRQGKCVLAVGNPANNLTLTYWITILDIRRKSLCGSNMRLERNPHPHHQRPKPDTQSKHSTQPRRYTKKDHRIIANSKTRPARISTTNCSRSFMLI
jgi:hypothetical protein